MTDNSKKYFRSFPASLYIQHPLKQLRKYFLAMNAPAAALHLHEVHLRFIVIRHTTSVKSCIIITGL